MQYWNHVEFYVGSNENEAPPFSRVLNDISHAILLDQTYLIKFLLRIRGALTEAPTKDDPVSQMPHAAPTTERPRANATPKLAYP